jgi:predicted  nucleic acid-binding Zn-ribbon protein
MTDELSALPPQLFAVDHAALRPCPHCGARQWQQGLTYHQCTACGHRDGLTPQEILSQRQRAAAP